MRNHGPRKNKLTVKSLSQQLPNDSRNLIDPTPWPLNGVLKGWGDIAFTNAKVVSGIIRMKNN